MSNGLYHELDVLPSHSDGAAIFFRCRAQEDYGLVSISANVEAQWGYSTQDCLDSKTLWLEHIHPEDLKIFKEHLLKLLPEQPQSCEYRFQHRDGSYRWLRTHLLLESASDIVGCCQDITIDRQLQSHKNLLQSVAESSVHILAQAHYREGMTKSLAVVGAALMIDRAYICEYHPTISPAGFTMSFAWARKGTSLEQMPWQHQSSAALQELSAYQSLVAHSPFVGMTRLLSEPEQERFKKSNILSFLWLPLHLNHRFWGFIGLDDCHRERQWTAESIDVLRSWAAIIGGALRHHQSEEQLVHDAFHDPLTGLPNRALFLNHLRQSFHRAQRHPQYVFAVLFLDLDGFKQINDTLGHAVGDQLLVAIAKRLAGCLRLGDTISRLGGDEFVVLLNDLHGMGDATGTAQRLRYQVSRAFQIEGHEIFTDVSVGITLSSNGYTTPEQILGDADSAMYDAKIAGKGRYRLFNRKS